MSVAGITALFEENSETCGWFFHRVGNVSTDNRSFKRLNEWWIPLNCHWMINVTLGDLVVTYAAKPELWVTQVISFWSRTFQYNMCVSTCPIQDDWKNTCLFFYGMMMFVFRGRTYGWRFKYSYIHIIQMWSLYTNLYKIVNSVPMKSGWKSAFLCSL